MLLKRLLKNDLMLWAEDQKFAPSAPEALLCPVLLWRGSPMTALATNPTTRRATPSGLWLKVFFAISLVYTWASRLPPSAPTF